MTWIQKLLELTRDGAIPESAAMQLLRTAGSKSTNDKLITQPASAEPIAVVGMAARVPGAENIDEFWELLCQGRSTISEVPSNRWDPAQYYSDDPDHSRLGKARWGGFLPDIFEFDPEFFGLTEAQALGLDPQQRLMLQVAWETFEHASQASQTTRPRSVGVFIGARMKSYGYDHFRTLPTEQGLCAMTKAAPLGAPALWGRSQNFIAAWISDRLDLSGPSMVVDTACSSSLTSLWLACQSLRAGECEMALAGGVDLLIDPLTLVMLSQAGALSPDGRCWTFDRRANGYVPGEGAGAVLLKPLKAALRDRDHVLGVIRAVAVNNDGRTMGVTTPSLKAQSDLLARVYEKEGIEAKSIGYLEVHGTGTAIGDPIELKALSDVFKRAGVPTGRCALGSVKTNIGHLHSAAGIASVIKVLLCLQNGKIPPHLNCEEPNPRLGLDQTPFFIPREVSDWSASPRRAGVSGFGFGGTNCHLVLEAAPPQSSSTPERPVDLLVLSARTPAALRRTMADMIHQLDSTKSANMADICASSRLGQRHESYRLAVVGASLSGLSEALYEALRQEQAPAQTLIGLDPQPSQPACRVWVEELCSSEPVFREAYNQVAQLLELSPEELRTSRATLAWRGDGAAFACAYALGRLLVTWGLPTEQLRIRAPLAPIIKSLTGEVSLQETWQTIQKKEGKQPNKENWNVGNDLTNRLRRAASSAEAVCSTLFQVLADAFVGGIELNWQALQGERSWQKVALPRSIYHQRTFNLDEPLRSPARAPLPLEGRAHPLLDVVKQEESGVLRFSRRFDHSDIFLRQHAVYGEYMLPGVTWLEMLNASLHLGTGKSLTSARDIVFHRPLILHQGWVEAEGQLSPDGKFEIRQAGTSSADGRYVTGLVAPLDHESESRIDLQTLRTQLGTILSGTQIYRRLRFMGYHHGPYYRNISWVASVGESQVLARIEGSRQAELNLPGISLFPGLLDSITIAALGPDNPALNSSANPAAFVPLSIGQIQVLGELAQAAFVLTQIHFWNEEACRCTQLVTDKEGQVLLILRNIASKRVPSSGFSATEHASQRFEVPRPKAEAHHPKSFESRTIEQVEEVANHPRSEPKELEVEVEVEQATSRAPIVAPPSVTPSQEIDSNLKERVLLWLLTQMRLEEEEEILDTYFLSAGFDSVGLIELGERLEREASIGLYPTVFFEYPTPRLMAAYLAETFPEAFNKLLGKPQEALRKEAELPSPIALPAVQQSDQKSNKTVSPMPSSSNKEPSSAEDPMPRALAIIGMGVRVPGASNPQEFWDLLRSGKDAVQKVPRSRWDSQTASFWGAFLDEIDTFDPTLFGISPREAPEIDPQARIFYEVAWETLENAGYAGPRSKGTRTGVWIGYSHDHYYEERVRTGSTKARGLGLQSALPNRLSYWMNWSGPSLVVNTLCSSSLVALHQASQSLLTGECDMALVGGVHLALTEAYYRSMLDMNALSPTGRCRTFDARADGYVPGEGAGAVLLKRLSDAQRDGDQVLAIVRGSAVNHGGRASRLSAPNPQAQARLLQEAWRVSGISPDSLGLIEAHGTGTRLGDPIELSALQQAISQYTSKRGFCGIGSLKSQIGHLESAAGIASLLKVVLNLQHAELTPTLHLENPNPAFDFENSAFFVLDHPRAWPAGVKRAGISGFGMLGVNAHVVLEEAPPAPPREQYVRRSVEVVRLSGMEPEVVQKVAESYASHFESLSGENALSDTCYTANTGRENFRYRVAVVGKDKSELSRSLLEVAAGTRPVGRLQSKRPKVAFLFTGQGSQYAGMGRALYETEPVFRESLERSASLLHRHTPRLRGAASVARKLEVPLLDLLYGDASTLIDQTQYAQPALFALEYALYELVSSWGITPDLVIGHSVGEYTAACVAGVFTLEDALSLVATRGQLMQAQPKNGAMAVLRASEEAVVEALRKLPGCAAEIAAVNSPLSTVISGPAPDVEQLRATISVPSQRLRVSHAFHSAAMEPALAPFLRAVEKTVRSAPRLPLISNLNGELHSAESVQNPDTWCRHLREAVRFSAGVQTAWAQGARVFWELGPRPVLSVLSKQVLAQKEGVWLTTLRPGKEEHQELMESVCKYYSAGLGEIDWLALENLPGRRKVELPTYPFQRQRFWLNGSTSLATRKPTESHQAEPTPARKYSTYQNKEYNNPISTEEPKPNQTQRKRFRHPLLGVIKSTAL